MMEMKTKQRSFPIGTFVLSAIALLGLGVMIYRYVNGLGAISNLSDGRGWGFWISFDLYCGVALAAGGFTLAGVVYIFNLKKYHPVVRPAILTAFLGYLLVILALLVDLGQPWYIWHAIIYWNPHSPLFEVAWCVMLYTTVLALEFSPAVFERLHWHVPLRIIRAIQIPLVIAGIVLSTGHQSSLGSMILMMPEQVNPLFYTSIMPILFFISAVGVGFAMVIFESTLSSKAFGHSLKQEILGGLGRVLPFILGAYLIAKLVDLAIAGELGLIFTEYPVNMAWWAEMLLGVLLPIILFSRPGVRASRAKTFAASALVVGGLILNRFSVSLFAVAGREGYSYFPHWMEIAVSAGLFAWAMIIIILANRLLPVAEEEEEEVEAAPVPAGQLESVS